jgi:hypothetical protein
VVHTTDRDVAVEPAATVGGLACLYWANCASCGATYLGPFRVRQRVLDHGGRAAETPGVGDQLGEPSGDELGIEDLVKLAALLSPARLRTAARPPDSRPGRR